MTTFGEIMTVIHAKGIILNHMNKSGSSMQWLLGERLSKTPVGLRKRRGNKGKLPYLKWKLTGSIPEQGLSDT